MHRPSVLLINRVYPPVKGATGRVLRDLARSFARDGWQVIVLTTAPKAGSDLDGSVKILRLKGAERPANLFVYGWIWFKLLFTALRLPRTDLVVTMTDPPLLVVLGQILKCVKKNKHMHWCQDLYPDLLPVIGVPLPAFLMNFFKSVTRKAMRNADKVVVIGRCMARQLGQDGFDAKQISLIPNWPDSELTESSQASVPAQAEEYDEVLNGYRSHDQQVKHGPKFRVLYAGNIGRAHPVATIMDAAEILQLEHPEIEFVFVGDGPRNDALARERTRRNLENIRLLPYQPASRLRDLMESGDLHIISMKDAAAGLLVPVKIYAALAAHRPCILVGPARCEIGKVLLEFGAGSVVAQGDALRLADEIRQMRLDSDKWFAAHEGARAAAHVFLPSESIKAWLERARAIVDSNDDIAKAA